MKRKPKQWFKWTVEFQVHRTWVEDGFDLDDERALNMLSHDISWAVDGELRAKVLKRPNKKEVLKAQGY